MSDSPTRPPGRRRASKSPKAAATRTSGRTPPGAGDTARQDPTTARQLAIKPDLNLGLVWDHVFPRPPREFRIHVRRPDDLLVFDLVFDNLQLAPDGPPRLARTSANAGASITVEFPPQSFGEQAFLEAAPEVGDAENETVPPLPSAKVRMAGPSRVVVAMPSEVAELPFTLPAVLDALRDWPMRLALTALPDPAGQFAIFDGSWLTAVTTSGEWVAAKALFTTALAPQGSKGLAEAVAEGGSRIAAHAADGLNRGEIDRLPAGLRKVMQQEVERLIERIPALGRGGARDVAAAALALSATESFAGSSLTFGFGLDLLEAVPFLPIVLAPHEPPATITALELPYRVMLSPILPARWLHEDGPVEHQGRTELWHTRLRTAPTDAGRDGEGKVRAIWSPDYPIEDFTGLTEPPKPFRMSLQALDRQWLVKLMAGFNEKTATGHVYQPRTSREHRLHLSALGGLLDVDGFWTTRPDGVDLEQWRHLAAVGRDAYVRVVYVGSLCPCGHAAALVKVTERKFETLGSGASGGRVAVLRQRFFIVVRERVREYTGASHVFKSRNFPFTSVEILTRVTPNLIPPGAGPSALQASPSIYDGQIVPQMVFWPMVTTDRDVLFEMAATDISGRRVTFQMPLLFISETANNKKPTAIKAAYNDAGTVNRRRAQTANAEVCYAPFTPADKGDPRLPTQHLTFAAGDLTSHFPLLPNYYPEIASARVGIRAVQRLLAQPNAVVDVAYPGIYKQHGFGESDPTKNTGQVFLQLINAVHDLTFGEGSGEAKSDALGALATPQMAIQGLSRIMGPVAAKAPANAADPAQIEAALGKVIGSQFDPADFFKGARILGGIDLSDLLTIASALTGSDVPKMLSRDFPDRVEASFEWDTQINQSDPLNLFIPKADSAKPPTTLSMHGVMTTPLANPSAASYEATADLTNFKVNLFGFVILWFEELAFNARKGQKPDVSVRMRDGDDAVQFGGPLEFVNQLRNLIPSNGFSDPPSLTVTPSGISASFSLNLPTVGVGVLTLSNASLGAGFNLPFDSKPASVRFNFSEREQPFSLTVSFLGGGGFFAIGISTQGVNEIEAALEFGAGAAIDLGVASGSVEIKAGIYFHWLEPVPGQGSVELSGYVRLHGELSVLGIISASLTFNLQLSYLKEGGKSVVWGEATLVVEIDVLFFSASVSVKCKRQFGGSDSDPKFIDLVPDAGTWAAYGEAFAEEAA